MKIKPIKKEKRLKLNLFRIIRDDLFWKKYTYAEISPNKIITMRNARSKLVIPRKQAIKSFIDTYKYISWDTRDEQEIFFWLLSETEE